MGNREGKRVMREGIFLRPKLVLTNGELLLELPLHLDRVSGRGGGERQGGSKTENKLEEEMGARVDWFVLGPVKVGSQVITL